MENDHAPGFPSAARFVAQAFMGADLDNRSLPGVYVAVVMGRQCRVSDRRIFRRADGRGRRAASDLSARAHLRQKQIPVRGQVGP